MSKLSGVLPWLYTAKQNIYRASDSPAAKQPLRFRGVNRSGLEYATPEGSDFLGAAGITQAEIEEIVLGWRANIIRLPFNQEWALQGAAPATGEQYCAALDQVIQWAAACGAYTLLDLQWCNRNVSYGYLGDGTPNRIPPLPTAEAIDLWAMLAARYRDEPAVLFDLFNEPHDPLAGDREPVCVIGRGGSPEYLRLRRVTARHWSSWCRLLISGIRRMHPRSLIFVSGTDWGFDLRGLVQEAENLVYSTHVYPVRSPAAWKSRFGFLARTHPVFLGEWGGGAGDLEWGHRLMRYVNELGLGWTAWSWSDRPHLLTAQGVPFEPSAFGRLVKNYLHGTSEIPA